MIIMKAPSKGSAGMYGAERITELVDLSQVSLEQNFKDWEAWAIVFPTNTEGDQSYFAFSKIKDEVELDNVSTITYVHNFDWEPIVFVTDNMGTVIIPDTVIYTSTSVIVTFASPVTWWMRLR